MAGMSFEQTMEQRQVLKQQQLFSLNLLAMDDMELERFLEEEELKNPFIQVEKESPRLSESYDGEWYGKRKQESSETPEWSDLLVAEESFHPWTFLRGQITRKLSDKEEQILHYMAEGMDSKGYISQNDAEISKVLNVEKREVQIIRELIQSLDPPGIGAKSAQECLCLQLKRHQQSTDLAESIVLHDLTLAAAGKYQKIAKKYQVTVKTVLHAVNLIRTLNPIPMNGFGDVQRQYIVPDIIILKENDEWTISLNASSASKVLVSEDYSGLMKNCSDEATLTYCRNNRNKAAFIQKCIEQRKQTLFRLASYILDKQKPFIEGKSCLSPMLLQDVAVVIGVNESTISRAVKNKYIQFPTGCWKIRDLFTKAINEEKSIGEKQIKEKINEYINDEDKKKPLSDQKLADYLSQNLGITIARRTVAKYREEMGIQSTRVRKIV